MHEGEKDGIFGLRFAASIGTAAKDQAQGVCGLMPFASSLRFIRFLITELAEAGDLKGICEVCSGKAIAEQLSECATSGPITRIGEVVVKI